MYFMKRIILSILLLLVASYVVKAQSEMPDLTDKIIIGSYIAPKSAIPERAQDLMAEKMNQILLRNGVANIDGRSRYILTVHSVVLDEGWTDTTPAKYAMEVEFHFYIGDVSAGLLFSDKLFRKKVAGNSQEDAYMQAVKGIRATGPMFKMLIDKAKVRIIDALGAREDALILDTNGYNINWW